MLTPRQHDILHQVSLGYTNREIGERLGISEHTVKHHVAAILSRLDAPSRVAAVNIEGTFLHPPCGVVMACTRPVGHKGQHGGFRLAAP